MKAYPSKSLTPIVLGLVLITSSLNAQLQHYQFTGEVEGQGTATELMPGLHFAPGDPIKGQLIIDPTDGYSIASPDLPPRNQIFLGAVSKLSLAIKGETLITPNGQFFEMGVFDQKELANSLPYHAFKKGDGDTIQITSLQPIPVSGDASVGAAAMDLGFTLTLTDSTGSTLKSPEFPEELSLVNFDTAVGVVSRWHESETVEPREISFRIDSLELQALSPRPVIAKGPISQIVVAGDDVELSMEPQPGNRHVRWQWSVNGIDFPRSVPQTLSLDNLQPQDSGTYRVRVWNSEGETTTSLARVQVESERHRAHPLQLSGWNTDVVIANGESSAAHPAFDGINGKWYVAGYRGAVDGLPASGRFTSATNPDVVFQLQPYNTENALWLPDYEAATGVLTLDQPARFESINIASATGSGTLEASVRFVFDDGSVSGWHTMAPQNWATRYNRSQHAAITGLGRLESTGFSHSVPRAAHGYGLYESEFDLAALGLADKTIAAFEFRKPDLVNAMGVFAVSGQQARFNRQPHLAWPSDSPFRIFEVASNPEGPWRSVDLEQPIVDEQRLVTTPTGPVPRFYRGIPSDLERQILALYSFDQNGEDRLGYSPGLKTPTPRYDSGSLLLSNENEQVSADRPRHFLETNDIHYNNYSVAYVFRLADGDEDSSATLLGGGRRYQWLRLKLDDGYLAVILGDYEFTHISDQIRIEPGQWHRLMIGVHTRDGVLSVQWNGEVEETISLPEGFRYQVRPANATDEARAFTFFDTTDSTAFTGTVDLLMATRRMLTQDEAGRVNTLLTANPVGDTVQRGRHIVWEGNLDEFRLQSASSATGPWRNKTNLATQWQGQYILPLTGKTPTGIYRLVTRR